MSRSEDEIAESKRVGQQIEKAWIAAYSGAIAQGYDRDRCKEIAEQAVIDFKDYCGFN